MAHWQLMSYLDTSMLPTPALSGSYIGGHEWSLLSLELQFKALKPLKPLGIAKIDAAGMHQKVGLDEARVGDTGADGTVTRKLCNIIQVTPGPGTHQSLTTLMACRPGDESRAVVAADGGAPPTPGYGTAASTKTQPRSTISMSHH